MNTPQKLLIDIEIKKGAWHVTSESGEEVDLVLAGKEIDSIPTHERDNIIYRLLTEHCDLMFCTTQVLSNFTFYPVPRFAIFAVDSKATCFGTIGGSSNLIDDNYPVGYVSREGRYGKIANSLKEFFSLVIFHPYWREVIQCEQMGLSYDRKTNNPQYFTWQQEIVEILKLSYNPKSIELLLSNIRNTHDFRVYASKDEARKTNTFLDFNF